MKVKNFSKKNITNKLYKNIGFSKNFSSTVLDDFIESIITDLIVSKKVKISSFGTFKVFDKKERIGRKPKTKIQAKISARKVVNFKPSSSAKKKINFA